MLRKMLRPGLVQWVVPVFAAALLCVAGCTGGNKPAGDAKAPQGSAANSEGGKRFVFLTNMPNAFWDACEAGLKEGEKQWGLKEAGISVTMVTNDGTAQGQINNLRQFATQPDIVGVAMTVFQADNIAIIEEMKNLQSKGVKVITVDSDVNRERFRDARPYYIGTNNMEAGKVLGAATKALLESRKLEKGAYVQFAGSIDADNARHRMDGVKAGLGGNYEERDRMPDDAKIGPAKDNVRNALTNHKDLVAAVGIWAYNGPAIADVAVERKKRADLTIVTFDADKDSLAAMEKGNMDAMCVQNPFQMGVEAVRLLKAMHLKDEATLKEMFPNHGQPDGDIFTTGVRIVVPDKDTPLKAEMFDAKSVEFMPLSTMKEWLAKYGLSSS